jgi:hypothetical protein
LGTLPEKEKRKTVKASGTAWVRSLRTLEHPLLLIAADDDVMEGTGKLDAWFARHT